MAERHPMIGKEKKISCTSMICCRVMTVNFVVLGCRNICENCSSVSKEGQKKISYIFIMGNSSYRLVRLGKDKPELLLIQAGGRF